ncbi:MAG: FHA domain-containing protein [Candidatus Sericytochromatia bacterium]|nr:FHA domain-containing protein [Candidatus Sericytochromatia bacterium]
MIVCPNCHAENKDGVSYCDECGTKLEDAVKPAQVAAAEMSTGEMGPPAQLVITRGGTVGREFPLEQRGETHIGRWDPDGGAFPEVDLTQDDPEAKISRKHARIFFRGGAYHLEDVGSLNGTFVNRGSRLMPGSPQELRNGDELLLGKTFFRFQLT